MKAFSKCTIKSHVANNLIFQFINIPKPFVIIKKHQIYIIEFKWRAFEFRRQFF